MKCKGDISFHYWFTKKKCIEKVTRLSKPHSLLLLYSRICANWQSKHARVCANWWWKHRKSKRQDLVFEFLNDDWFLSGFLDDGSGSFLHLLARNFDLLVAKAELLAEWSQVELDQGSAEVDLHWGLDVRHQVELLWAKLGSRSCKQNLKLS